MAAETAASPPGKPRSRLVRWYVGAAVMLLNTLLFFVVLNLVLWPILSIHQRMARPAYLKYPDSWYRKVYPTMADSDWKELVKETKSRPFNPEPYVMFTEPRYDGRYLHVSDQGYRLVANQGPWPLDPKNFNILTFGGSSMFGYGVSDDQTIPSYMQAILQNVGGRRVCVYNFGRRAYYSTQERILFEQLLHDGVKPNLAVFMDGLNDFLFGIDSSSIPKNPEDGSTIPVSASHIVAVLQSLPIGQMAQLLSQKYLPAKKTSPPLDWTVVDPIAIDRYIWNKKAIEAIANSQGVATVFVFQPAPTYEYDLSNHILQINDWDLAGDQYAIHGYPLMAQYIKANNMGTDFLWLADMQLGIHKEMYIDKWHFSAEFSKLIATEICKFVNNLKTKA